jgi:exodeoxyribonuclease-3
VKVASWNVNGLRAVFKKGFMRTLNRMEADGVDVVCLQETRCLREQVKSELGRIAAKGWFIHVSAAEKKGYSGVTILSRRDPDSIETRLGQSDLDVEGRAQIARFGDWIVANGYFPNGSGPGRDHSRIPYKLRFFEAMFDALEAERAAGTPIVVVGDFNTAHQPIDLARPKGNRKTSGFTQEECDHLQSILDRGWTDTFRHLHPEQEGAYSWWSNRPGVREKNVGWRIDLAVASPGALARLEHAVIHADIKGSDHCPIQADFNPA